MTSLKTTIVVTVLLVVGYSVYQALYDTPASAPKQPTADDASPGADQYPGTTSGRQASRRSAGSRFATGAASDRFADHQTPARPNAADEPTWRDHASTPSKADPADSLASADRASLSGKIEDPFRRSGDRSSPRAGESRSSESDPADSAASDHSADRASGQLAKRGSSRTLPSAIASDPTEAESAAKTPGSVDRRSSGAAADTGRGRMGWSLGRDAVATKGRTEKASGGVAASDVAPRDSSPASRSASRDEVRPEFQSMIDRANRQIDQGKLADVLREMTRVFERSELRPKEEEIVVQMLDQLAGTVVYSRQHLLEPPYAVKANENLYQIAQRHMVPWQLLAKINGIRDPNQLTPGMRLKVVRGPFDAKVYLDRRELLLSVDGCYAGRFPVGVGRELAKREGDYVVRRKQVQKASDGAAEPSDARNPLGRYYIELDEHVALHGTNDPKSIGRADGRGSIALSDRDLEDVFDMLVAESSASRGSSVTILR